MTLAERIGVASEIRGNFTLRSGQKSDRYFDKYRFESDPLLLSDVAEAMVALIPAGTQVLCGLEMGGIPVVTMLSHHARLPAAFIRKAPKEYGTCKYAEGADLQGRKIALVEDIVSTGGAIVSAANMLRSDGIEVHTAMCVLDRQTGGVENLRNASIDLISLLSADEIDKVS